MLPEQKARGLPLSKGLEKASKKKLRNLDFMLRTTEKKSVMEDLCSGKNTGCYVQSSSRVKLGRLVISGKSDDGLDYGR
jgi:hypothetical protein